MLDDRTTKARIRDAAIDCFAEYGVAGTTARKVATVADVSPGLVMHHYGSMDGLRAACDEYVAAVIRTQKQQAMAAGPGLDPLAALRDTEFGPLMAYLARVLVDDAPAVAKLVDDLVADAEGYIRQGVENGMLRPSANDRGRAALVTLWSLGGLVLHHHMRRLLGVDLTDPKVTESPDFVAYLAPAFEIFGNGIFTEDFAAHIGDVLAARAADAHAAPPPPTTDPGAPNPSEASTS